jgi:cytochrome P450
MDEMAVVDDALPEFRCGDPVVGPTLALRRNPLTTLIEPYRRFGRIFRTRLLGRSVVVLAGTDANEFAWRDADQWAWDSSGAVFRDQFGPNALTQMDGAPHAAKRRQLAPAFRERAVQKQAECMARVWVDAMAAHDGEVVDLRGLCERLAAKMTGQALLRADMPDGAEDDIARLDDELASGSALGSVRRALTVRPAQRARRRALRAQLTDLVRARRDDWSGDDLVSEILRGLPHGAPIPPVEELLVDVVLLLHAGCVPVAHQVLWTLLLLQSRPEWCAELRAELATWSPGSPVTCTAHPKLRATVLESSRLRPAIPFSLRVAARDLMFSSRRIPAGAAVLHAATLTHFLDEVYDDPMAFHPERFLDGSGPPRFAHGTFGGGPHACLGQPLALAQLALAVATVTRHAELVPFGPVSLRARFDGVATPVERSLPVKIVFRS